MERDLFLVEGRLWDQYRKEIDSSIKRQFDALEDSELSIDSFGFYTSVSAVFSSKIEGEVIDLDSYIKYKRFQIEFQPDYTRKIDDLYDAYVFAQGNALNATNIESAHAQITKHMLNNMQQGKLRKGQMFVLTKDGRIEYVAVAPDRLKTEMHKFYHDLECLLTAELSFEEAFFYASMLHLVFVKIHPFDDGNGRTARLIEKWFLAQKLGAKAWFVQSERNYYNKLQTYYSNIRRLGLDYDELRYEEAMPFLRMLPEALFCGGE